MRAKFINESRKSRMNEYTVDEFFTWFVGDEDCADDWQTTNTMFVDGEHAQDDDEDGMTYLKWLELRKDEEITIDIEDAEDEVLHSFTLENKNFEIYAISAFPGI